MEDASQCHKSTCFRWMSLDTIESNWNEVMGHGTLETSLNIGAANQQKIFPIDEFRTWKLQGKELIPPAWPF